MKDRYYRVLVEARLTGDGNVSLRVPSADRENKTFTRPSNILPVSIEKLLEDGEPRYLLSEVNLDFDDEASVRFLAIELVPEA